MKKIYLIFVMILFVIVSFFVYGTCNKVKGVSVDTKIYYVGESIIYNNLYGDICELNTQNNIVRKIIDKKMLISAYGYILCKTNNTAEIYDYEGEKVKELKLDIAYGEVHDNILFYIERNPNTPNAPAVFKQMNLKTMAIKEYSNITTSAFRVNKNKIFYESDNMILMYDLKTKEIIKIYEGRYCYYFYVDNERVYLSDYKNDNKILVIDNKETKLLDISTVVFCVNKDTIYYINHIEENERTILEKMKKKGARIYWYNIKAGEAGEVTR